MISIEQIKKLREETGVSISEVKKALQEANGDVEKAKEKLSALGRAVAGKKSERETKSGLVESYIHPNAKTGVLLDIRCETDFVAKNPEFKNLAHELCLQIAAMNPLFVSDADISAEILKEKKSEFEDQAADSGKPAKIVEQIIDGKLNKFKEEVCLVLQPWVKDDSKKIKDVIEETIGKIGEKIEVKRFSRFEI